MSGITYKEAAIHDAPSISQLILKSQDEFCFHEYTEDGKKLMQQLCGVDAIRSYLERGDIYYVAECDDRLVGVAGMRDKRAFGAQLRGQGVASTRNLESSLETC